MVGGSSTAGIEHLGTGYRFGEATEGPAMIWPEVGMLLGLIALRALPLGVVVNRYRAQQAKIVQVRRLGAWLVARTFVSMS